MGDGSGLYSHGEKMKKVLCWISEMQELHPEITRVALLQQAEIKFDLCPADCVFLEKNFSKTHTTDCRCGDGTP
ncbi:hypothetical protein [Desulfogranum japonicum]|uniref:hypothetical protein n=1 Tax=Desulfogranum japonicum TaxID=231447 RepID=UPI000427C399|nr:hypothetical protein [Desulfogranum japonicum]